MSNEDRELLGLGLVGAHLAGFNFDEDEDEHESP
jgi:hypothetical protein